MPKKSRSKPRKSRSKPKNSRGKLAPTIADNELELESEVHPCIDPDNELELESQVQHYLDISNLPADHTIVIHFRKLRNNFPRLIEKIYKLCSRGGTRLYSKNSTFYDPVHLGFILKFKGKYLGQKIAKSFFFLKEDVYLIAFCRSRNERLGSNWLFAAGSDVGIKGSRFAGFTVDYGSLKGCMVGLDELGQALFQLSHSNDGGSFLKIAHHISEAVRNKDVEERIFNSFKIGANLSIDDMIHHFHCWQAYCKLWCKRYFQLDTDEQKSYHQRFQYLGINNIDDLDKMLQLLRMENQEERKNRRSNALKLYSQGSVSHDCIVRRTTDLALGTPQQLQVHRETILNTLMRSGGDPNIWTCIKDALRERDLRYAKLKIQHTDLFVKSRDLSETIDDEGYTYVIVDELMLCEDAL